MKDNKKRFTAIRPSLEKNLAAYAMAGAAGLSMVCSAPAEGAVVYTKVKALSSPNSVTGIDLNQDGTNDFGLNNSFFTASFITSAELVASAYNGNQVAINAGSIQYAKALNFGDEIGPNLTFANGYIIYMDVHVTSSEGVTQNFGQFENVQNKFLALKLSSSGQTYYGWARVDTKQSSSITCGLVDFAYQNTPNTAIAAGQGIKNTTSSDTLGWLAVGADGLQVVRNQSAQ